MSNPIISVRQFAELTRESVLAGAWNQRIGWLNSDEPDTAPCCIGSKIAIALLSETPEKGRTSFSTWDSKLGVTRPFVKWEFEIGVKEAAARMGITSLQVHQLFQFIAQMDYSAFGITQWPIERDEAWDRLLLIEHIPSTGDLHVDNKDLREIRAAYFAANRMHWQDITGTPWKVFNLDKVALTC